MADAAQGMPRPMRGRAGRKTQPAWKKDLAILERLVLVERRHLAKEPNRVIARALNVDEKTVRRDIERLHELWLEHIGETQESLRGRIVAELEDIRVRALRQAESDEALEKAVLFDDPDRTDEDLERLGIPGRLRVHRDNKGSATFRSSKAQSLNVARQATMDKAQILGLVITKLDIGRDLVEAAKQLAEEFGLDSQAEGLLVNLAEERQKRKAS